MVPASLIFAGSLAARAGSTAEALAEVAGAELEPLPSDRESEPQAVRARAVVATAATASARVGNMGGPFRDAPRGGDLGTVYGPILPPRWVADVTRHHPNRC